jgi:hypothetical protein
MAFVPSGFVRVSSAAHCDQITHDKANERDTTLPCLSLVVWVFSSPGPASIFHAASSPYSSASASLIQAPSALALGHTPQPYPTRHPYSFFIPLTSTSQYTTTTPLAPKLVCDIASGHAYYILLLVAVKLLQLKAMAVVTSSMGITRRLIRSATCHRRPQHTPKRPPFPPFAESPPLARLLGDYSSSSIVAP